MPRVPGSISSDDDSFLPFFSKHSESHGGCNIAITMPVVKLAEILLFSTVHFRARIARDSVM